MEIVVRAAITFGFLWLITRAIGKKELSQLSAFELVLLVVIGDLVQQGVTQEDMSLTGSLLAVGTIALLVVAVSYAELRWVAIRRPLEGIPAIVVRDGELVAENMEVERLTEEDVLEAAREQGIADLGQVRVAILEADGKFSFIRREEG